MVRTFFILPKNECARKSWITAINRKEGTFLKNVFLCLFIVYPSPLIPRKTLYPKNIPVYEPIIGYCQI